MIKMPPRWLTAIPLPHWETPAWWEREAGVLCLGFREIGSDARFVLLGAPRSHQEPFLFASRTDMESGHWWMQQGAAGVVLYSWGAPRYEPIARAIKAGGLKLILRMDSDGINSPRVNFPRFLTTEFFQLKDAGKKMAAMQALTKTLLFRFHPRSYDTGFRQHLQHADLVLVESPIAEQRLKRFLLAIGAPDCAAKLRMTPPQISTRFTFDPAIQKKRQIIAVGRWESWQKDAPMLIATLSKVLEQDRNCTAVIAGSGEQLLRKLSARMAEHVRSRVTILGRIVHEDLVQHYRASLTLFFPSRFEGFPNSAVEALASGCSVVGPAVLASMNYCTQPASGTVASRRSPEDFADAVLAELESWDRGDRKPEEFSRWWQEAAWAPNVARRLLQTIEQFHHPRHP